MIKLIDILDEIKINQPIRINADLVNKMMNYVYNNYDFSWDEYIDIKNKLTKENIGIMYYYINKKFYFSSMSKEDLLKVFNTIKPYFDEKNINIKEL